MSKRIHVRPGKGQSKMGFGVGIIFCLIGVFVVIPTLGHLEFSGQQSQVGLPM